MASGLDKPWQHHDISNPALTALSVYAVEGAVSLMHQYSGDVDFAATIGALGVLATTWITDRHFWLQVYLTATTLVTLAWIFYAEHGSPFTATAITAAAASTLFFGVLYQVFVRVDRRDKRKTAERLNALMAKSVATGDWEAMFACHGCKGVKVIRTEETRAGYTKICRLPRDGSVTYRRVRHLIEPLETALDVDAGCVRFERGNGAEFAVHVVTRDVLAETVPFPFDPNEESISVNDPFGIGLSELGDIVEILVREIHPLLSGTTGAGKSNLWAVLLAQLTRCSDTVIWMVDLKGGRTAKPWLLPWLTKSDERATCPVIDWVATTLDEVEIMLHCLVKVIDYRSHTGVGEKIIPSPEQPQIIFICDETAVVFGQNSPGGPRRAQLLENITGRGRSEAIAVALAVLRSTVTMIGGGDLKSLFKLRLAMGVSGAADARLALDDSELAAGVAALKYPGTLYMQQDAARPIPTKSYRMDFDRIPEIAAAHTPWRPGLERDLELYLGTPYSERWSEERAGHLIPGRKPKLPTAIGVQPAAQPQATVPTTPRLTGLPTIPQGPITPAYRTASGKPIPRDYSDQDVKDVFAQLAGDLEADLGKSEVRKGPVRMLGLIAEAGAAGIKPGALVDRLNSENIKCVRQTVQGWLKDEVENGTIVNLGDGTYVTKENYR
jgi:hypothetical protein